MVSVYQVQCVPLPLPFGHVSSSIAKRVLCRPFVLCVFKFGVHVAQSLGPAPRIVPFLPPLRSISGASYQSMAQPAPSSPASPDGTADDGAFCGGTGSSDGRHTADILVLSSTNSRLPAYARLPPPICALTRPRCTRCELLVSLGSAGLACVLLAGALLLAACWCARRREAASRFACSAEATVAA